MITVKPFKESHQDPKPTREDYVIDGTKKSAFAPVAFLMFLTTVAIYLKSLFPSFRIETSAEPSVEGHKDEAAAAPNPFLEDEIVAQAHDPLDLLGETTSSGDNVVALPVRVSGFLGSDSPPIDFKGLIRTSSAGIQSGPIGGYLGTSNDNQANDKAPFNTGFGSENGSSNPGSGKSPTELPDGSDPDILRNRAPRVAGPVYLQDLVGCRAYLIAVMTLLAGATDADGDRLSVVNLSSSAGTLTAQDGSWLFVPDPGWVGDITLTYSISDGTEVAQQIAYFRVVEAPTIVGTDDADNLIGTHCADVIDGRDGDDNIDTRQGHDLVHGGAGDDHIVAGAGNDIVYAGPGSDIVFAGAGDDIVFGGLGKDRLFGEDGDDIVYGEADDDLVDGGAGADVLFGGSGNDTLQGGTGNDVLDGGEGNDGLHGGADDDVIVAGAGNDFADGNIGDDVLSDGDGSDVVSGGAGDDYVIAAADAASDLYSGDDGDDTLDYSSATLSIVVDVGLGHADGLEIGRDLISDFERIISGGGDDLLIAGSRPMTLTGGAGNDTFEFHSSNDDESQPDMVRKITDFTIGDRIVVASYEVRYRIDDENDKDIGDLFDSIYLTNDNDRRPIRFRFEKIDDEDLTFVDVNEGGDSPDYYSIELLGRHHLEFTVSVS